MSDIEDQIIGCIVGGAIGDAMCGPYEGSTGSAYDPNAEWRLSDDTQLTLATCEAIGPGGTISPEQVASRFCTWYRKRRLTGLGASTLKALLDLDAGAHWALAGRKGEMAAGNGAAMRAAPLAFCLDPSRSEDRTLLRDICWITHQSDEAYAGALAIVAAIRFVTSGSWSPGEDLVRSVADILPDTRVRDTLASMAEIPDSTPIPDVGRRVGCSGYVAEYLDAHPSSRLYSR